MLRRIFLSTDEPRLRAGWRLLIQTVLMFLLFATIGIFFVFIPSLFITNNINLMIFLSQIVEVFAIGGSIYLVRRFLDKRSFKSLGLSIDRFSWNDIIAGIVITFIMMSFIFFIHLFQGWVNIEGFVWTVKPDSNFILETLLIMVTFILVGWNEELLSRGYHLQTLASGTNMPIGIVLSSAIFGFLHMLNPNASWVSTAGIFLAGVFLAYAYIRTNQLWLPIGLHIGWNFFEGVVFGFPVSGMEFPRLLLHAVTGPEVWTGGAFGPEAGLVLIPGLLLGFVLIYIYTARRPAGKQDLSQQ